MRGAVIVLHGVGDRGYSMTGLARLLTAQGYIVLAPDSRAHGGSGGERITYGVLERHDIARWIAWLDENYHPRAFYGYGASLGGATLIQSLNEAEPRFRAIVAECPFSDFHSIAYDRLSEIVALPCPLFAPIVEPACSSMRVVGTRNRSSRGKPGRRFYERLYTPVLLIHGTADGKHPDRAFTPHGCMRRIRDARSCGKSRADGTSTRGIEQERSSSAASSRGTRTTEYLTAHSRGERDRENHPAIISQIFVLDSRTGLQHLLHHSFLAVTRLDRGQQSGLHTRINLAPETISSRSMRN